MNELEQAFNMPSLGQYPTEMGDPAMVALMQQLGQPTEGMGGGMPPIQDVLGGPVPQLQQQPTEQDIQELAQYFGLIGGNSDMTREFLSGPAGYSDPAYDEDFSVVKLLGG